MVSVDELLRKRLQELATEVTVEPTDGLLFITGLACIGIAAASLIAKRRVQRKTARQTRVAAPARTSAQETTEASDDSFPQV